MHQPSIGFLAAIAASFCAGPALCRPIGSAFNSGNIRAAGFPDPLRQNNLDPVSIKSGSGGGSTGGGFGGFASAAIGIADTPTSTTLSLSGNAFHINFDGYTAARSQTPIILELTNAAQFTITNSSTADGGSILPVTFEALTGSISSTTPQSGKLGPGTYSIKFAVAAGHMNSFEALNTVGEWYAGFGGYKIGSAQLDWKMLLTPAPSTYGIGIPPPDSVYYPQGQSFTPSFFGTLPSGVRPGNSPGMVSLTSFKIDYDNSADAFGQLFLYDHFPYPEDAAAGTGSFATGTHTGGGVYSFTGVTLDYNTRYYAILPGAANIHDGSGDPYTGGVDMFFRPDLGRIAEGYGSFDIGFSATFEYISNCPGDLNNDGVVDDADFSVFAVSYDLLLCSEPAMPSGCPANLNNDVTVDDGDFSIFVVAYDNLLCP